MADTGSQELMQKVRDAEAQALEFKSEAAVLKEMIHTLKVCRRR